MISSTCTGMLTDKVKYPDVNWLDIDFPHREHA